MGLLPALGIGQDSALLGGQAAQETRYLLDNPTNAAHLKESLEAVERGETVGFASVDDLRAFIDED